MHTIIKRLLLLCGFGTVGVVTHQRYIKPRPDADTQQVTTITQEATPPEQQAPKPPAIQEQPSSPTTQDAPSLQALQLDPTTATTPKAIKKPAAASQQAIPLGVLDATLAPEHIAQPIWWKPLTWGWREWGIATCTVGVLVGAGRYYVAYRHAVASLEKIIEDSTLEIIQCEEYLADKEFIQELAQSCFQYKCRYDMPIVGAYNIDQKPVARLHQKLWSYNIYKSGKIKKVVEYLDQESDKSGDDLAILEKEALQCLKAIKSNYVTRLVQHFINYKISSQGSFDNPDDYYIPNYCMRNINTIGFSLKADPLGIKTIIKDLWETISDYDGSRSGSQPYQFNYYFERLHYVCTLYQQQVPYYEKLLASCRTKRQTACKHLQACCSLKISLAQAKRKATDLLLNEHQKGKLECYNLWTTVDKFDYLLEFYYSLEERENLFYKRSHPILEYFPYTLMECYKDNKERNLPQPPHYDLQCLVGQYMLSFYEQQHNEATCVYDYWQKRTESEKKYDLYEDRLEEAEAHLSETQKYTNAYKHFANIPAGEQKTKMFAYLCACEYQKIQDDCAQLAQEQKNNFDYYSDKQVEYKAKTSSSLRAEIRELQTGALLWTLSNNMDIKPTEDVLMITKYIMHACDEVTFVLPEKAAHIFPSAGCEDSREAYVDAKPGLDKLDVKNLNLGSLDWKKSV